MKDWPRFLTAGLLVMVRISGLFVFAPIFSSSAVAPRIKAGFVFAMTILLAPAVSAVSGSEAGARYECAAGGAWGWVAVWVFTFHVDGEHYVRRADAGHGVQLFPGQSARSELAHRDAGAWTDAWLDGDLDHAWRGIGQDVDRGVCSELYGGAGWARRDSSDDERGDGSDGGWDFLAGLQLASPVIAAALAVEVTVALIGKLSPQLPTQILSIPVKTMVSYTPC